MHEEGETLVLFIITLIRNCEISALSISNKSWQCRGTDYWLVIPSGTNSMDINLLV